MSKGPALLSRRSLLRGAASATVVAALAAVSSCSDGSPRAADGTDDAAGSALLRLGHEIADDPATTNVTTNATSAPTLDPVDDAATVRAVDEQAGAVRSDFTAGRTTTAAGWLLSATEAQVLVAYAGACPMPAC